MLNTRRVLGSAACAATVIGLLLPMEAAIGATACTWKDDAATQTRSLTGDCDLPATLTVEDGWTIDGNGHTITVDASGGFAGPIIRSASGTAGGSPATLRVVHLTITALHFENASGRVVGILFDGAQGTVSDVRISGVSRGTVGDNGYGVEADNSVGAVFASNQQVKIDAGTTISGYQRAAVYAHGKLKLRVFRATIGSADAIAGEDVDGILATGRAYGSIKESRISLSDTEPASAGSFGAGVQMVGTRHVEVKRNVFTGTDADFGISVANPSQTVHTTAVVDCNLFRRSDSSASDPYGVAVGRWDDGPKTNVALSNATFEGNWKHATGTISGSTVTAGPTNEHTSTYRCQPSAPTQVFATGGNHRSRVTWNAAAAPEYAPLTGYQITATTPGHRAVTKTVGALHTSAWLTGLRNRDTYQVTVTAQNSGGQAAGTDWLYPTKMRLKAKPGKVLKGHRSVLRGRLSSGDPSAHLRHRKVVIWAKARHRTWKRIATVRTRSTGTFRHAVKPRKRTIYKAVYGGRPDLASRHKTKVAVRR